MKRARKVSELEELEFSDLNDTALARLRHECEYGRDRCLTLIDKVASGEEVPNLVAAKTAMRGYQRILGSTIDEMRRRDDVYRRFVRMAEARLSGPKFKQWMEDAKTGDWTGYRSNTRE